MSVMTHPATVPVWTERGIPVRLVWRGDRYTVSDAPTPLRDQVHHETLTHPIEPLVGWRFQATRSTGESLVFDVRIGDGHEWQLLAVYS